ncbi:MAG: thioredoxin family protein [Myxococcota bacterium]
MGLLSKIFGGGQPKVQPVSIDDDNFRDEVLRSDVPVLLDVWGPSCGPCMQLEPIIMNLAAEYDGRVKVCEMNGATSPRTMQRLGVRGTPTVLYYRDGKEVERVVGFRGRLFHEQTIHDVLGVDDEG